MTKHIADHRSASDGGRLKQFLRISRDKSDTVWRATWSRPSTTPTGNRRVVEYIRIARADRSQG